VTLSAAVSVSAFTFSRAAIAVSRRTACVARSVFASAISFGKAKFEMLIE
jgi:hypothetical protein